eukprot:gene10639-2861_t
MHTSGKGKAGSCQGWATAPSWKGPYTWNTTSIFQGQPAATSTHIEDAHMWVAPASASHPGSFHAIFHSDVEKNSRGAAGGHAWSDDGGVTWTFSTKNAFNNQVVLTNGSNVTLRQRERPHLVLDTEGRPIVLTNGAGWENDCDHVFTFAQPINTK